MSNDQKIQELVIILEARRKLIKTAIPERDELKGPSVAVFLSVIFLTGFVSGRFFRNKKIAKIGVKFLKSYFNSKILF